MLFISQQFVRTSLCLIAIAMVLVAEPVVVSAAARAPVQSQQAVSPPPTKLREIPANVAQTTVNILAKYNTFKAPSVLPRNAEIDRNVGFIKVAGDGGKDTYIFSGRVEVVMPNGSLTSFDNLKVPCSARLYHYMNSSGNPLLYRVQVLGVSSGASAAWTTYVND